MLMTDEERKTIKFDPNIFQNIRNNKGNQPQYTNLFLYELDILARELGRAPNMEVIKQKDEELYYMVLNGPMLPQIYSLGDLSKEENTKHIDYIKKVNRDLAMRYKF